jgi:synaptojanin
LVFLNLLSKEKPQEEMLSKKVNSLFERFKFEKVQKFHYDFHYETAGDNFANLSELVKVIRKSVLSNLGYFIYNSQTKATDIQKGVYRTNCLDCLDRTNVTQARISILVLSQILQQLKTSLQSKTGDLSSHGFGGDSEISYITTALNRMW